MVDHQANDEEADAGGAVLSDDSSATSADDKTVPLAELVKVRQQASEAKKQLDRLQAELQGLRQGDGKDEKPPQQLQAVEDRLRKIERSDNLRSLMTKHGLDQDQAEAVDAIMESTPGLTASEAKQVAALRNPDVFSSSAENPSVFNPTVHGSARPKPGSAPAPAEESDYETRLRMAGEFRKNGRKKDAKLILNNLVGRIASQQIGRPGHKLIDLNKMQ